jgi:high-affinity K+ transport system ATPase subunit B
MNTVFSLLFTPIGRYAIIAVIVVLTLSGVYFKIRADAIAEVEAMAVADALRRTQDAIRAGDAVDVSPDGLLKSDGHRRD